jgi:hypothetical protein
MKKSELLRALQTEIQKHNLSTFMHEHHRVGYSLTTGNMFYFLSIYDAGTIPPIDYAIE